MARTGTALDSWQRYCLAKRRFARECASETARNPAPAGRAQAGVQPNENRHGHHQAFQARRGPRRSDRDRCARDDRDRGQGLRASEGPHGNLSRRRIRGELLAENQDRSGGRNRPGRQDDRHYNGNSHARSDRGRKNLRPLDRHRRAHPHRRDRHCSTLNPALTRLATGVRPMTFKKPTRAGLVALALGVLFALFLSISVIDRSYAEGATAAPAAAAEPASPPACVGGTTPVLANCPPNSGDPAWLLTSIALGLLMTVPRLGLLYGGMVRKKNVGATVMTSLAIPCLISIVWLICTYSLAFRAGTPFIGGLDRAFLQGIVSDISKGIGNPNPLAPTIPETVYLC